MADISVDELAYEITSYLEGYGEEIEEKISEQIDKISKEIVKELKNDTTIPERTGKYRKGFFAKTVAQGIGYKRNKIGNRKPQLTHLLEDGHNIVRNDKIVGRAKAYPHWDKAQEKLEKLMDGVIDKL